MPLDAYVHNSSNVLQPLFSILFKKNKTIVLWHSFLSWLKKLEALKCQLCGNNEGRKSVPELKVKKWPASHLDTTDSFLTVQSRIYVQHSK
jgi:hypothetical protein